MLKYGGPMLKYGLTLCMETQIIFIKAHIIKFDTKIFNRYLSQYFSCIIFQGSILELQLQLQRPKSISWKCYIIVLYNIITERLKTSSGLINED